MMIFLLLRGPVCRSGRGLADGPVPPWSKTGGKDARCAALAERPPMAQMTGDTGEIIARSIRIADRLIKLEENVKNLGMKSIKIINADISD